MIQKDLIKDDLYAAVNGEWLKKKQLYLRIDQE